MAYWRIKVRTMTFVASILFFCVANAMGQHNYGLTAFGTDLIRSDEIREEYGQALDRMLILYDEDYDNYDIERKRLAEELRSAESFSYVSVFLFKNYLGEFDYIIDFVEKKDSALRLNYGEVQYETIGEPAGLISKWNEYEELSNELFDKGEIDDMECPVLHCTWSFNHPKLRPFLTYFEEHVPKNKEKIVAILHHSDSVQFRAASAFLLAHGGINADELVSLLLPAIRDPESWVRNNSMRVIYYVVKEHPDIDIDTDKVIAALDYPSFTDRNKALVILRTIPLNRLTKMQLARMAPILLEILEKHDAHNYGNALRVLRKISNREYAIDDIASWKKWWESIKLY